MEAAAAVGNRAVIAYRADPPRDALANTTGECRSALAIEVALQSVTDRLVQQNSGPSRPQHHNHLARRRVDRIEAGDRLARRRERVLAPSLALEEKTPLHAPAATRTAGLTALVLLCDHRDAEAA